MNNLFLYTILVVTSSKAAEVINYFKSTHSLDLVNSGFFEISGPKIIQSPEDNSGNIELLIRFELKSLDAFMEYEKSDQKKAIGEKFVQEIGTLIVEKKYRGTFYSMI